MTSEHRPMADRLMPLPKPLLAASYDEPHDYLGQLFSEQNCAIDGIGQVMTPPWKAGWPPLTLGRVALWVLTSKQVGIYYSHNATEMPRDLAESEAVTRTVGALAGMEWHEGPPVSTHRYDFRLEGELPSQTIA